MISMYGILRYTYGDYNEISLPAVYRYNSKFEIYVPKWVNSSKTLLMEVYLQGGNWYNTTELEFVIALQYTKTTD